MIGGEGQGIVTNDWGGADRSLRHSILGNKVTKSELMVYRIAHGRRGAELTLT